MGFALCGECHKVGRATTEGDMRAHKCKKDEERAAPTTPSNTAETPMRVQKRRRSKRTTTPPPKKVKTPAMSRSASATSRTPADGITTRSGRKVVRTIAFEEQRAETAPIVDSPIAEEEQSDAEALPAPAAPYKAVSHKSFARWGTDTTGRFGVLNRALAENYEGPASAEACNALVNLINSSWGATRNREFVKLTPSEEESPAELKELQQQRQQLSVTANGKAWAAHRALKLGRLAGRHSGLRLTWDV